MTQVLSSLIHSGGRKSSSAQVKLIPGNGNKIIINGIEADSYFQQNVLYLQYILSAYEMVKTETQYDAIIKVNGGGLSSQAQAIRLALSKAFIEVFPNLRPYFKKRGFLTRNSKVKERRKYGLKKARKAAQFSKR